MTVFFAFDETTQTITFVKPIDIGAILEFLSNIKTVARSRISPAIVEMERRPVATKQVAVKRERCESWQVALVVVLEDMMGEKANAEQKANLTNLRRCMLETTQPAKKAKSTPGVSTASTEAQTS
jgi:acyl-CoA hydrolase